MTTRPDRSSSKKYPGVRRQSASSFEVRVYDPATRSRRAYTVRASSFAQAAREQDRLRGQLATGRRLTSASQGRQTAASFATGWYAARVESGRNRQSTLDSYEAHVAHITHPRYGLHTAVRELDYESCQAFVQRLRTDAGLAPKTIANVVGTLSQVLKWIRRIEPALLQYNPLEAVELPRRPQERKPPPDVSEIHAVVRAAQERDRLDIALMVELFAATGIRNGELCGLRVTDVLLDADPPQLAAWKAVPTIRGRGARPSRLPQETKTPAGVRTLTLDDYTAQRIRAYLEWATVRAREHGYTTLPADAYLFWPYTEGPLVPHCPKSIVKLFEKLTGQGGLRAHRLRHFHASHLAAAGIPEAEMMGRLGWATRESAKPYIHWLKAKDRTSADVIADVLRRRDDVVVPIRRKSSQAR